MTFDNEDIRRTTLIPGTLTIRLRIHRDAAHGFFPQHRRGFVRLVDRFLRSWPPR
jgi:hypothetical protein